MEARFRALLSRVHETLKPLGYGKDGANFRLYGGDGLCRIINFQKNRYNTREHLEFVINYGLYFEKEPEIQNRKFKEYECAERGRTHPDAGDSWWVLEPSTDQEALLESVRAGVAQALESMDAFPTRECLIEALLSTEDGSEASRRHPLSFHWAELLVEMGYRERVYERIRDSQAGFLRELAEKIRSQ